MTSLVILFFTAMAAATFLPIQSEILLGYLHQQNNAPALILLIVATAGNVLGSFINWLLGRYLIKFQHKRWFPIKPTALAKATKIYQKYGVWTLLLAWAPFIGDPLTFVAGIMRTSLPIFFLLVTLGKAARYALVLWAI